MSFASSLRSSKLQNSTSIGNVLSSISSSATQILHNAEQVIQLSLHLNWADEQSPLQEQDMSLIISSGVRGSVVRTRCISLS